MTNQLKIIAMNSLSSEVLRNNFFVIEYYFAFNNTCEYYVLKNNMLLAL